MAIGLPMLVTGAAGRVGGVGGAVVETLRQRDCQSVRWSVATTNVPTRSAPPAPRSWSATSPAPGMSRVPWRVAEACISACACPRLTWRRPSRRGTGERREEFTTMHLRAGFFLPRGSEFALT